MLSLRFVEGTPQLECQPPYRGLERELPKAPIVVLLTRLVDDAFEALDSDREVARASLRQASALLKANQHRRPAGQRLPPRDALAPWQMRKTLAYVDSRLGDAISLTKLAEITRLSVGHFSRAFRGSFGESPHRYIINRRVRRAQHEMLATSEPLCEIALSCGFADQAHMCRLFLRIVGCSPHRWRRARFDEGLSLPSPVAEGSLGPPSRTLFCREPRDTA
jgi:AraC family transcriptional regulator